MPAHWGISIGQISLIRFGGFRPTSHFHYSPDEAPLSPAYGAIYKREPFPVSLSLSTLSRFFEFALPCQPGRVGEAEWAQE